MSIAHAVLPVTIERPVFSYSVVVGKDLLTHRSFIQDALREHQRVMMIVDSNVDQLAGVVLKNTMVERGITVGYIVLDLTEANKTRWTKHTLEDQLMKWGFGADDLMIAVGGGVLSDIVGFIAATWCRGVRYWIVPTTLLAMVDAAIGGKTGLNTQSSKNSIGSLYHPELVIADIQVLKGLSEIQMKMGLSEMLKHALLAGGNMVHQFSKQIKNILSKEEYTLIDAIRQNASFKIKIIEQERAFPEVRHLLNLGHTIGHALEKLENYTLLHGQAIAIGLATEAFLYSLTGYLSQGEFDIIIKLINEVGIPLQISKNFSLDLWDKALIQDKKSKNQQPRFVVLEGIGKPLIKEGYYCHTLPRDAIFQAIQWAHERFKR